MMSKHPAGLLNFPLKPSKGTVNSEVCPGTPLWTSTSKKLERSRSSDSPETDQDRTGLYLFEAPFTDLKGSRCSSMGILNPEDMSSNFDTDRNSIFGLQDLEKTDKLEEFRVASYLLAPSAEVENTNEPFSLDCTEEGIRTECEGRKKSSQNSSTDAWSQDKLDTNVRLSSSLAQDNHLEEKFKSRSTSIGYVSGLSSSFKSSGVVRDSYGFGNLTFTKDASFCEKMELAMDGELFLSNDSEKNRLIDEAERQHEQMFPDKPENSFMNASTSQLDPPAILSQSTYFQMSTSRLGSLETYEGQRPKSEELRPGLGFSRIISPTNRPFRVIKGSPRDECDPVESQILPEQKLRTSNAFKNLESSFLKPETTQPSKDQKLSKEELLAILVKGRENPQELAKILYPSRSGNEEVFEQLISHLGLNNNSKKDQVPKDFSKQGTQLLPSFLEATVPQVPELNVPSSDKDLPPRLSPGYAGKSRIPRLSPKEKSHNPEKVVRHSSPMKKPKFNNGSEFKTPSVPLQESSLTLPVTSDRNGLVWLANPVGRVSIKSVTLKNMLSDQNLSLTLSIRESNCFKFADSGSINQAIVISPGSTFEIRVAFLPTISGWSMGRLGIKRAQNVKGPTLKAVVKLIGHCGLPNIVMEKSGVSCNIKDVGDFDLGRMTKDFSDEFSFKNEGDATGFIKMQVFDDSSQTTESSLIVIHPPQFVVKPGESRQIRIKVSRSNFREYFQSTLVIYQGSEVLRQGWRAKIGASKPKKVELSEVFDREDPIEEIKLLKSLQVDEQVGFQFFQSTSKTVMSLTGSCASTQPSFLPLPMEETMNESQMLSQTFSSTSMMVNTPETILEEVSGSHSEPKIPRGFMSLVRVDPEVVFFPPTVVGSSRQWKVRIKNGSTSIHDFKLSGLAQPFAVTNKTVQVKPMSSLSLSISYQPVTQGTHEGTLILTSSNYLVLKVSLRGSTTKSAIPAKK